MKTLNNNLDTMDIPSNKFRINYSPMEDKSWNLLYNIQMKIVQKYASKIYLEGLKKLRLPEDKIPQLTEVAAELRRLTGWSIEPVTNLVNFKDFFKLLSSKHFPAASFIRNYNEKFSVDPDVFHEIFGHCPLLTNPDFADFMKEIGEFGKNLDKPYASMLGRLFWFTIEVGLIRENNNLRIYGAAIVSSESECNYALNNTMENRREFDLVELLRTPYDYDKVQKTYFIINSFEDLYKLINGNLISIFKEVRKLGMLPC